MKKSGAPNGGATLYTIELLNLVLAYQLLCLTKNAVELGATDRADALCHATTRV